MSRAGDLLFRTELGLVRQQHSGTDDYTYTFPTDAPYKSFFIINDGATSISVEIEDSQGNTFTFAINTGEYFNEAFDGIASVAITAGGEAYRSFVRR